MYMNAPKPMIAKKKSLLARIIRFFMRDVANVAEQMDVPARQQCAIPVAPSRSSMRTTTVRALSATTSRTSYRNGTTQPSNVDEDTPSLYVQDLALSSIVLNADSDLHRSYSASIDNTSSNCSDDNTHNDTRDTTDNDY